MNASAGLHYRCGSESLFSSTTGRGLRIIWSLQIPLPSLFFLLLINIFILTYQFFTLTLIQNLYNLLSLNTYFFSHYIWLLPSNNTIYWNLLGCEIVVVMTMPARCYKLSEHEDEILLFIFFSMYNDTAIQLITFQTFCL